MITNALKRITFSILHIIVAVFILSASATAQVKSKNPGTKSNTVKKPSTGAVGKNSANNKGNSNVGNSLNVDNSQKNVNINVDNSKSVNINNSGNTVVIHNSIPYRRPPYVYGGHKYYCYHPYFYHPYRPFYWGPVWHPWGFFIAKMAATAIIVSVNSKQYHYDQGVYYVAGNNGYTVVPAPVGATILTLPEGAKSIENTNSNNTTTNSNNTTVNNYYYGATYYEKSANGYTVVPPTAGYIIENLPEGGKEEKIGKQTYVKIGETYYQPIEVDGKKMYEVVDVEDDK